MAISALEKPETVEAIHPADPRDVEKADAFLAALTELSLQHGVAIGGAPVLYMMEREDFDLAYMIDAESNLSLA